MEKKDVDQAIQKERNKLLNPEDMKMSPGDEREYGGWRGGLTKKEREEHDKDEVIQEEVNWLKYTPSHYYGGSHYKKRLFYQEKYKRRNYCQRLHY